MTVRERGRPITLLDVATYNCGLPKLPGNLPPNWWANPNPFANYGVDQLYAFVTSYVPQYEPGTHFEYSSLGFGLLGIALARRAGKSYEELLIERVCGPLGLANTRIALSADMQKHLVQSHDMDLKSTPPWEFLEALQGAGRSPRKCCRCHEVPQSMHRPCAFTSAWAPRSTVGNADALSPRRNGCGARLVHLIERDRGDCMEVWPDRRLQRFYWLLNKKTAWRGRSLELSLAAP